MSDIREYAAISEDIANDINVHDAKAKFVQRISADLTVQEHARLAIDILCSLGVRDSEQYDSIVWASLINVGLGGAPRL